MEKDLTYSSNGSHPVFYTKDKSFAKLWAASSDSNKYRTYTKIKKIK